MSRKSWCFLFAGMLLLPNALSAEQLYCKLKAKYVEDAFGYSYASLDTVSGAVRLGDGRAWTEAFVAKRSTIALGRKYVWRQKLYDKIRNRNYNVDLSFRVLDGGAFDLYVGGYWKVPLECKS